ncbi:non-homologous end joining protein Ku [Herbiconiux sp. SYSU D00978]|uniref:non-homologous end joining protein Ku n=1 Tax=Herbiconiux sp. SYSU D00978 TaxID=2812562 RepID=UPI001A95AB3C|nr:Ku protein [Herbiconiux sp. SYSU D00978]
MRSIWKGAITFGLVNVPVKVYSATEDHDVPLHQVHDADGGRIRYQRVCEVDGQPVDYEHIVKAYDDGGRTVVLTKEDLNSLPVEKSREIDVVEFVPSEQVDPIMFDRSYYLEPDSASPKAYALLRETLEATDRTAIVTFSLRQKTRLAALRVRGDVIVLQTLLWNDEVREARFPSLDAAPKISERELQMSEALVKSFESDFTPEKFVDEYQTQLRELIDAKLEQGDALDTEQTFGDRDRDDAGGGEVLDLMEALRRSVEKTRGGKSDDDEAEPKRAPAKSSSKTPAKSTSAKSTAKSGTKSSTASKKKTDVAGDEPAEKPARRRTTKTA